MPALFLGHGSPMNAIEDNRFSRAWSALAGRIPLPRAVLCISAHWETRGPRLSASPAPETIHDFHGFPQALFDVRYPAPGHPDLAEEATGLLGPFGAALDPGRGLDHGCWSLLCRIYPGAGVPVVQLSLDVALSPARHFELASRLAPLRSDGVLILASGNIVHNLRLLDWRAEGGHPWAERFDAFVRSRIAAGERAELAEYANLGADSSLAVPTAEHYLPLLYALAVAAPDEPIDFFNDDVVLGSISMTSLQIG
jgi:4,5-DOPA dioxygenase extradiol